MCTPLPTYQPGYDSERTPTARHPLLTTCRCKPTPLASRSKRSCTTRHNGSRSRSRMWAGAIRILDRTPTAYAASLPIDARAAPCSEARRWGHCSSRLCGTVVGL